jgi:hypothetical protein
VILPKAGGGRRLNGDAPLLLLLHKVSGGGPLMHLTNFVDLTRQLENTFGGGGFAGIDVGKDTNIAVTANIFCKSL